MKKNHHLESFKPTHTNMQTDSTHFSWQISTDRTDKQLAASQRDNHLLTTNQNQMFYQIKSYFYKNT